MSEQQADINDLTSLTESMADLVTYATALKQGAGGFAYMLPADWQGPAMHAFLGSFETWSVSAHALIDAATKLQEQANTAKTAYSNTVEGLDESWTDFQSNLP